MRHRENGVVQNKLLELVYRRNVRANLPLLFVQIMIAVLLYQTQPFNAIMTWFGISLAYNIIHSVSLATIKKNTTFDAHKKISLICILITLSSCVLAGCLFFFNNMPVVDRIILTMTLLALVTGSNGAFAGDPRLYRCYTLPIVAPLILLWFANVPADTDSRFSILIGIILLVITAIMARIGNDTFEFFSDSIKNIEEKDLLTKKLMEALKQQELSKRNAEESNQSKTRLLAAVSHDLRQPVHVLNLFGEALKKSELEEKPKHIVDNMQLAIRDLSQQISVLLDITKLDEITYKPVITELCVVGIIEMVSHYQQAEIEGHGLKLVVNHSETMCVMSDAQLLMQIIRNLVGNAIKYTSEGQITITMEGDGDDVLLSIEDTGIGIKPTEVDSIFEEYYQLNNPERNPQNGLGLGLSIVKRAADLLGHTLTVQSTLGEGSKFTIRMKRGYPKATPASPTLEPPVTYNPNQKLRVHLVDDDLMVCESMRSALEAMNCEISVTHSTEETSEYFSSRSSPDLFIIDIRLHGTDSGYNTRQYAKAFHPKAKCVYISGERIAHPQNREFSETPFIRKPVSGEQLETLLAETLSEMQSDR